MMTITLTISPDEVPITDAIVSRLPITPDRFTRQVLIYECRLDNEGDPMEFLSEFVYLGAAFERVLGAKFMAYLEVDGGPCYLGKHDLRDLSDFHVMIGINVPGDDRDLPPDADEFEDRDDGDELRGKEYDGEPPDE